MTAWVSKQTGDWTRASNNADSPWHDGVGQPQALLSSYPGGAGTGDTVTIGDGVTATQIITLDANPANSIASITEGDSTSYITVATTRTLTLTGNPAIDYGGTNILGFIRVATNTLTITHDQGAGTVTVLTSSSGYGIYVTSGGLTISNIGGTALSQTGGGRVMSYANGTVSIVGNVTNTNGYILRGTGGGTCTITGNVVGGGPSNNNAIALAGSSVLNVDGNMTSTPGSNAVSVTAGTLNWIGDRSIAAGEECWLIMSGGTMNLATSSGALNLECSGQFVLLSISGTLAVSDGTGGDAKIVLQSDEASAAICGSVTTSIITMLNLAAGNVKDGVTIHGVEGTYDPAGGGGLLRGNKQAYKQ